ncbi:hypothetical protein [Methylomagnum sp.]
MSLSPEQAIPKPRVKRRDPPMPRWQERRLSPLHGLIFLIGFIGLAVAAAFNYEAAWGLLSHSVILILEIAEQVMDTLLELVGMAPGAAQMVTAYVGVVVGLVLLYFLVRRLIYWYYWTTDTIEDYRDMYAYLFEAWNKSARVQTLQWWQQLDWLGKVAAVVFGLLILVPVLLGLSAGLGMLVSMLL